MSEVVRLTLVAHALTDAMASRRFPVDEPLNSVGLSQVKPLDGRRDSRHVTGPERRAGQTAELLGLQATAEPRLADLDCGRWRGEPLSDIGADELEVWLTEPARAPHGGESIAELIARVANWLESLNESTVAVTHPAVIRAAIVHALGASPNAFWRIDVAPVGRTVLHFRSGRWTLRL